MIVYYKWKVTWIKNGEERESFRNLKPTRSRFQKMNGGVIVMLEEGNFEVEEAYN